MRKTMDDPRVPGITYRGAAAGRPVAVLSGTSVRVQTLVVETQRRGLSMQKLADKYGLTTSQVQEAMAFYAAHRHDIDAAISQK
jgi:uncharacterized protein (DUF433 family)